MVVQLSGGVAAASSLASTPRTRLIDKNLIEAFVHAQFSRALNTSNAPRSVF